MLTYTIIIIIYRVTHVNIYTLKTFQTLTNLKMSSSTNNNNTRVFRFSDSYIAIAKQDAAGMIVTYPPEYYPGSVTFGSTNNIYCYTVHQSNPYLPIIVVHNKLARNTQNETYKSHAYLYSFYLKKAMEYPDNNESSLVRANNKAFLEWQRTHKCVPKCTCEKVQGRDIIPSVYACYQPECIPKGMTCLTFASKDEQQAHDEKYGHVRCEPCGLHFASLADVMNHYVFNAASCKDNKLHPEQVYKFIE